MLHFFLGLLLLTASPSSLIPQPVSANETGGVYICGENCSYRLRGNADGIAGLEAYLQEGLPAMKKASSKADVVICFSRKIAPGAYRMSIRPKGISIEAADVQGAFYAIQSLQQLRMQSGEISCCEIEDYPRFQWRGFMLDLVSTWHDMDYIKREIDAMALCKMNVLHLHLSDTHAWRLESKFCPRLHETTSWRYGASGEDWKVNRLFAPTGAPGATGGYYTQDEIRSLIEYAALRHIEIIPEIDLPGHAYALLHACPEFRCDSYEEKAAGTLPSYIVEICVGHPEIFNFVFGILDEVAALFPSKYIHIGGDEAKMSAWEKCSRCQDLMRREGMTDVRELQYYFTKRVAAHLLSIGKIPVGWDEIAADPELDKDAVVMKWHTACRLPESNKVVMATHNYTYLCYYQDAPVFEKMEAWSRYLPLDGAYLWEPLAEPGMESFPDDNILGIESCLWSSHFPDDRSMDYMTWPRLAAIAERAWSPANVRDYDSFKTRAETFSSILGTMGIGSFDISKEYGHRPEKISGASHLGRGCKVSSASRLSSSFPAAGLASLTDGRCGDWNGDDGAWLGFEGEMDVTVDLGSEQTVHFAGVSFLCHKGYSRDLPERLDVSFSQDGSTWGEPVSTLCQADTRGIRCVYPLLSVQGCWKARYVRFKAVRRSGPQTWPLLVDELIIL